MFIVTEYAALSYQNTTLLEITHQLLLYILMEGVYVWYIHGRSTIYAKTHLRTQLNRKYGIILSQFWQFLDDTHTKFVLKSNSNVSNSNFGRGYILYMMASSALRSPLRILAPINLIHIWFSIVHRYQKYA